MTFFDLQRTRLPRILSQHRFWRRARTAWLVGFLGGILSALLLQLPSLDLPHLLSQSFFSQAWVQAIPLLPSQPTPQAKAGLNQAKLWSSAAKLMAYQGHLPYDKAQPEQLVLFSNLSDRLTNGDEYLQRDAAQALVQMMQAAQSDNVSILLVSGFRDIVAQNSLYEERAEELGGSEAKAAKSVAPPGYSEHHTGYAVDVTDGSTYDFRDFALTPAFQWMMIHAHNFGFELSFPEHNTQGVDYEPWHWRFVASPAAARVFEAARGK
ncbi:MAG TPA: M15 family metallopeptidase [Allocoleopsis sp.]